MLHAAFTMNWPVGLALFPKTLLPAPVCLYLLQLAGKTATVFRARQQFCKLPAQEDRDCQIPIHPFHHTTPSTDNTIVTAMQ